MTARTPGRQVSTFKSQEEHIVLLCSDTTSDHKGAAYHKKVHVFDQATLQQNKAKSESNSTD